ncbi:hypothetical protein PGTUg99_050287 [Puccinia graminis f. sp. tritici]|uniref:Tyr recombinase domain-containing protein n=1 Tax=Puccinia graminis f. sp. tritici TaxID=56615 RepID=A0A5B0PHC8_PUCGR|nr:hypothetical protein PGTUg99_050286 [Puccinia graminis f. sp. tritici]KAA1099239.1 hypothetical protein PGTUg99_050287 [Puccinia graminis f. sp. tritici]
MVEHLLLLYEHLSKSDALGRALLDMALVAFWGMARLGELTCTSGHGNLKRDEGPRISDVNIAQDRKSAIITIWFAKTATGGNTQQLFLTTTNNKLCPVKALINRITGGSPTDSLFGITGEAGRTNLTKSYCTRRLQAAWQSLGLYDLSGHSFRVGGASLRNALEVEIDTICKLGRWKSSCYKLYIKAYSAEDLRVTLCILEKLDAGAMKPRV